MLAVGFLPSTVLGKRFFHERVQGDEISLRDSAIVHGYVPARSLGNCCSFCVCLRRGSCWPVLRGGCGCTQSANSASHNQRTDSFFSHAEGFISRDCSSFVIFRNRSHIADFLPIKKTELL